MIPRPGNNKWVRGNKVARFALLPAIDQKTEDASGEKAMLRELPQIFIMLNCFKAAFLSGPGDRQSYDVTVEAKGLEQINS